MSLKTDHQEPIYSTHNETAR